MEYSFFLRDLGAVPEPVLGQLHELLNATPIYEVNNTNFNLERHTGISGVRVHEPHPAIEALLSLPQLAWTKHATYTDYQFNLLRAGGQVLRHNDQYGNGAQVFARQKVHVPLIGSEVDYFFWSSTGQERTFRVELGRMYVFNDVADHAVYNRAEDRVNLLIHWQDPSFKAREALYGLPQA